MGISHVKGQTAMDQDPQCHHRRCPVPSCHPSSLHFPVLQLGLGVWPDQSRQCGQLPWWPWWQIQRGGSWGGVTLQVGVQPWNKWCNCSNTRCKLHDNGGRGGGGWLGSSDVRQFCPGRQNEYRFFVPLVLFFLFLCLVFVCGGGCELLGICVFCFLQTLQWVVMVWNNSCTLNHLWFYRSVSLPICVKGSVKLYLAVSLSYVFKRAWALSCVWCG